MVKDIRHSHRQGNRVSDNIRGSLIFEADPYYKNIAQCLRCSKIYPIMSTGSATLCANCLGDKDAQHYKAEKEEILIPIA